MGHEIPLKKSGIGQAVIGLERKLAKISNRMERARVVCGILYPGLEMNEPIQCGPANNTEEYIQKLRLNSEGEQRLKINSELRETYARLGDVFFDNNEHEHACEAWSESFKIRFSRKKKEDIIKRLSSEVTCHQSFGCLKKIQSQYCFEYCGCFGEGHLNRPSYLMYDHPKNRIIVSDHTNNKISIFNGDGQYLNDLNLDIEGPYGMFSDPRGGFWVCEFGGKSRIVRIGADDRINWVKEVNQLLGDSIHQMYPKFGAIHHEALYLFQSQSDGRDFRLFKIQTSSLDRIQEIYLCSSTYPISPVVHQDRLYFGDFYQSALFSLSEKDARTVPLSRRLVRDSLISLVFSGDDLFILEKGGWVMKVSLTSGLIFSVDMKEQVGASSHPVQLAMLKNGDRHYLLVCDFMLSCIHKFLIR